MYIQEIALNNFRIYKGDHKLIFNQSAEKNVTLICGNNGFGKTTLLTSLIWCLYGKQMQDVDEVYRKQIQEVGGYKKFLSSCINRMAKAEGGKSFSVSLVFSDITIPAVPCNDLRITRTYTEGAVGDQVKILIDGNENELANGVTPDIFINDFILPREIAKFFFFDAEKIVSLAEMFSIEDRRKLSKAYSEVLGIKKYEDLKEHLQDMRIRFRKDSASGEEQEEFSKVQADIKAIEQAILLSTEQIEMFEEEIKHYQVMADGLQERLIREGHNMTVDQLNKKKKRQEELLKDAEQIKQKVKELLDLAPFAMAGGLTKAIEQQLLREEAYQNSSMDEATLNEKVSRIIEELKQAQKKQRVFVSTVAEQFFTEAIINSIKSQLGSDASSAEKLSVLHDFKPEQRNAFRGMINNLRTSFRNEFKQLSRELGNNKFELTRISREISDAESKEKDQLIRQLAIQKMGLLEKIRLKQEEITKERISIELDNRSLQQKKKIYSELTKKITMVDAYAEKDKLTAQLIGNLDKFLEKFKQEKRKSLEEKILSGLRSLMHKSLVNRVEVKISEDLVDILLYNSREEVIPTDSLSKGEQQLYATAVLKALVMESKLQFPVFIDSPMQKFDGRHSRNIIVDFYPGISKQVVLFPLLNKEMTKDEYALLEKRVEAAYLIENVHQDLSRFEQVIPAQLFETYNKNQEHVQEYQNV